MVMPPSLRAQLDQLRSRLWNLKTGAALSVISLAGCAGYLVVFLSDRVWDSPRAARLGLWISLVGGTAVLLAWLLSRWIIPYRKDLALGRYVKRARPRLGDRLLGALELLQGGGVAAGDSPELRRAALEQVAKDMAKTNLQETLSARQVRRLGFAAATVLFALIGLAMLWPQACGNALIRFAVPWAAMDRYTFTRLETPPPRLVVAHGEPFEYVARVHSESRWHPSIAASQVGQQRVSAERQDEGYRLRFPALTERTKLRISLGDASAELDVVPLFRPGLSSLKAKHTLPEYLGYEPQEIDMLAGAVTVVEGSRLALQGSATRALREMTTQPKATQEPLLLGQEFRLGEYALDSGSIELRLSWRDVEGLAGSEPRLLRMDTKPDAPPRVAFTSQSGGELLVLEDEALEFDLRAEDDFGVKEMGLRWDLPTSEGAKGQFRSAPMVRGEMKAKKLVGQALFSPKQLGIGPGQISLRAYSLDYKAGREPSLSSARTLRVLDQAQHAKLVQERFSEMRHEMEQLTRAEEENRRKIEDLKSAEADAKRQALAASTQAAQRATEQWKALNAKARVLMQSAARNASIDPSVMHSWGELSQAMGSLAAQDLPVVELALRQASQASASGDGQEAQRQVEQAMLAEDAALEKMRQLAGQGQVIEQQLEASTFVNRLRRAADVEAKISVNLRENLAQTIGLLPEEAPPEVSTRVLGIGQQHQRNQADVSALRSDLSFFQQRVQRPAFVNLAKEMESSGIEPALSRLTDRVLVNQAARAALEAERWAAQLQAWANLLAPANESGSIEGDAGPKVDFALMLEIARLVQREVEIRRQTRLLEQDKARNPGHLAQARHLGGEQAELAKTTGGLLFHYASSQAAGALRNATTIMGEVTKLLNEGETGGPSLAAETEVIELLGDAGQSLNVGAKKAPAAQAMQEMMAQLQIGNNAGGNPTGALSSTANQIVVGESSAEVSKERRVDKAGGAALEEYPEEFREALGSYFERMEKRYKETPP